MISRPAESFWSNSCTDFLSEIKPSITRPKNLTGEEWIDGMYNEKSVGSDGLETLKCVLFNNKSTRFASSKIHTSSFGAGVSNVYSRIILMPAKNKIMERVQPAKIPLR